MGLTLQGAGAAGAGFVAGSKAGAERINNRDANSRANAAENRTARDDAFGQAYKQIMSERPDIGAGQAPQQGAQPGAIPGAVQGGAGAPVAEAKFSSRRDHYKYWRKGAENAAMKFGGLDGLTAFQNAETLNSMQEMQTWGEQGVMAIENNSPVDAAKFFNTMFEVSPEDFGLEAVASNGKVYLKGEDGALGQPIDKYSAMAYMDMVMKTPENFLDIQEQQRKKAVDKEAARANLEKEATANFNAQSTRSQADQYVKEGDSRERLRNAQAYGAIATGGAALNRAANGAGDDSLAWNENNMLKIEEMAKTAMEGGLGFGGDWMIEGAQNTQLHSDAVGAAVAIRRDNPPEAMGHQDAATISRAAFFNGLKDDNGETATPPAGILDKLNSMKVLIDDTSGEYGIAYNGMELNIPPDVALRIQINQQQYAGQ